MILTKNNEKENFGAVSVLLTTVESIRFTERIVLLVVGLLAVTVIKKVYLLLMEKQILQNSGFGLILKTDV